MRKLSETNWKRVLFLVSYQVLLLLLLPFYFYYAPVYLSTFIATASLLYLTGLSITTGYHRYYSHRTFKTNKIVEIVLLFFGSMTAQGSVLRWAYDHRNHHAYVDTDKDPYTITKGFLYAHCFWILDPPSPIQKKVVPDLFENKLVMFQHRHYELCMVFSNALATLFFGWVCGDYLGAFFLTLWLRMFLLHHFTWFINSLAHTWGDKPYCKEQTAVNNYIISLLTFGEGYHNYHHTFANDYRNGIRWYHFDPSKWLIWSMQKVGLVYKVKMTDPATIKKKMVLERKSLLLEQIKNMWQNKKEELESQVNELSGRLVEKIAHFNALKKEYLQVKKQKKRELIAELRQELKQLKKSIREDLRFYRTLSKQILRGKGEPLQLVQAKPST